MEDDEEEVQVAVRGFLTGLVRAGEAGGVLIGDDNEEAAEEEKEEGEEEEANESFFLPTSCFFFRGELGDAEGEGARLLE